MGMTLGKPVRVGAFTPNGTAYFTRVFAGFGAFCRTRPQWKLVVWPQMLLPPPQQMAQSVTDQQIDGVISLGYPMWEQMIAEGRTQAINIEYNEAPVAAIPRVGVDEATVGRLAAEHFQQRGLQHMAAVGNRKKLPAVERVTAFIQAAAAGTDQPVHELDGFGEQKVRDWLATLPQPVGVFCWNDETAKDVYAACQSLGVNIPRDVAVIAVDNEEMICESLNPPLTSIDTNARQIGYEAAALLERLMDGEPAPDGPVIVPPVGVVSRGSTDMLAVTNPNVAEAMRFIRQHADGALRVEDVLDHLMISRSALERQFHAALGRTPRSEIVRVLVERARDLLVHTDLPVHAIAAHCGYPNANHFTVMFRKQTGQTPSAFRAQTRLT